MRSERADVGETAEGVGGDQVRALGQVGVVGALLELGVGDEFIGWTMLVN